MKRWDLIETLKDQTLELFKQSTTLTQEYWTIKHQVDILIARANTINAEQRMICSTMNKKLKQIDIMRGKWLTINDFEV